MVLLIGHVERRDVGREALQEQNYARLLSDITKLVIEVIDPDQASEAIARAFHTAESGTPGPVAVVLPEDIFDKETEAPVDQPRARYVPAPRREDLERLAGMLSAAERPLILVGGALYQDPLHDERVLPDLTRLAERWMLPVSPTHRRAQLFDSRHPNYGGYMGIRVPQPQIGMMKTADLIVALGERLGDVVSQSYTFPAAPEPQVPLVHVWPDADEVGRVWRPTLGIPASPAEVIRGLLEMSPSGSDKRRAWVSELHEISQSLVRREGEPTPDGVDFADIVCAIDRQLSADAVVTSDAGNFSSFIHRYTSFQQGQVMLSSVVGAMGSGVPMAVAAGLRRPGKQVVAFVGDGGTLMTGNELATAVQYGANIIMIVADNSMYGTIGMHSYMRYPQRRFMEGTRLTNPDFAAWGRSFGAEALTLRDEADVEDVIAKAFAIKDRPVVVHCLISALQMSAWRRYTEAEVLP
jgi:acetolactate synthase-1/2/3 large subunit